MNIHTLGKEFALEFREKGTAFVRLLVITMFKPLKLCNDSLEIVHVLKPCAMTIFN